MTYVIRRRIKCCRVFASNKRSMITIATALQPAAVRECISYSWSCSNWLSKLSNPLGILKGARGSWGIRKKNR